MTLPPDPARPGAARADAAAARALIHEVRRRLRRTRAIRGGAAIAAVAAGVAVLSFALDLTLDLPVAVRAVHLAAVAVGAIVVTRWAFAPLRRHATDEELALAIEHDVPEFEDRLVSALDFERRIDDPDEPESRAMMAAAVRDASAIASRIDAHLLVDRRPAHRALFVAAAGIAAVVAAEIAFPQEFRLWLRRGVLLEDVDWPRRTTILVEEFSPDAPRVVTRGDDLRVIAVAQGARPADLDLHLEELVEGEGADEPTVAYRDVRKMTPVPDQPGRYQFEFRAVAASFRFWVTGGDDLDRRPLYRVTALVPPRVAAFEARIEYPAYTKLPPQTLRDPVVDALQGSKATLRFTANMPLVAARIVPSEGPAVDATLDAERKAFEWSFAVERSLEAHVELRAAAGHANRAEDDVFRVNVVTDRAPTVRMLHPHGRVVATPQGTVPVKLLADDDFGLEEVRLDARQGASASWTGRLWPAEPGAPPYPGAPPAPAPAPDAAAASPKSLHVYRPLDLRQFTGDAGVQLKPGDVLQLVVRAKDVGGQTTDAGEVAVEIVSEEDLAQRLSGEMTRLRDELGQTRRAQRKLVGALKDLGTIAGERPDAAAVRKARDLQVDQGRAIHEATRFSTGIERVFDQYVLDRLGSIPTVDRLMPIYHEFLAQAPGDGGEVFPRALYRRVLEEKRANRLYDPEILGILLDVMDLSERLREVEGPASYDAIERWAADDAQRTPAGVEEARRAADRALATLDAIDERLQRFEDLAALLQLAKTIHRGEEELIRNAKRGGAGSTEKK